MTFAKKFHKDTTTVGNLSVNVTEETIAQATGLALSGEKWSKNHGLSACFCNRRLKPEYQNINWSKGIPRSYLKDEWQKVLMVLQKYLTNEGCYIVTFIYEAQILLHFEAGMELNFPYFLLRSIQKMSSQVQKNTKNPTSSLHHYGLIKLLVREELKSKKVTWEVFLAKNLSGSPKDGSPPPVDTYTNLSSPG